MRARYVVPLVVLLLLIIGGVVYRDRLQYFFFKPTETHLDQVPSPKDQVTSTPEVVARNLDVPWDLVFLPDDEILATERGGTLHLIKSGLRIRVPSVTETGEGGLLGMTLHPNFKENQWLYLYHTEKENGVIKNSVERYRFADNTLEDKKIIIEGIPGAPYHDGGRMAFGPDGYLYITTGDASVSDNAQNKNSLAGKILRVKDDGSLPADNPFGTAVYSYGHRNPQGIAWDDKGRLWATEHGRSGAVSGYDEVNLIISGGNYGWPVIEGEEKRSGMISPMIQSGASETWAPSGIAHAGGRLFFAGLRGESLYETSITEDGQLTKPRVHFRKEYGRLRAVVLGPDNYLYITTSNRDGRGEVREGDDKIIRLAPESL